MIQRLPDGTHVRLLTLPEIRGRERGLKLTCVLNGAEARASYVLAGFQLADLHRNYGESARTPDTYRHFEHTEYTSWGVRLRLLKPSEIASAACGSGDPMLINVGTRALLRASYVYQRFYDSEYYRHPRDYETSWAIESTDTMDASIMPRAESSYFNAPSARTFGTPHAQTPPAESVLPGEET